MRSSAVLASVSSMFLALASNAADAKPPKADSAAIQASIASPDRPSADRERDARAKPETVLTFLGARPGMQVIDYFAGDGYYTELLARIVGEKGKVIEYNNGGYASFVGQELAKRFADKRVPNTLIRVAEIPDLNLPDNSLDAALFVMSYHDIYYTPDGAKGPMGDPAQMLGGLFKALKPGGVVVVQDHVAVAGTDPAESVQKLHRIDPEAVKREFDKAGFKLDGEDQVLKNGNDDHTKLVFDPSIRHKTDQFLFRFRKPG